MKKILILALMALMCACLNSQKEKLYVDYSFTAGFDTQIGLSI